MKFTGLAIATSALLSLPFCLATASQPAEYTEKELRIGARVLASNLCSKMGGDDRFLYTSAKRLVLDHMEKYRISSEPEAPNSKQVISFLNTYKNDMFCQDGYRNQINYIAYSIKKRSNHGLIDLYLLGELIDDQEDVLISFNGISRFDSHPHTRESLDSPLYETILDTAIRECERSGVISICELVFLLEDDKELGAKRYEELSEQEKIAYSPIPEFFGR